MITWTDGNDTGFHDHDVSRGAVAVVEGEVTEERLLVGGPPLRLHFAAGTTFDFDASHVHRMCLETAARRSRSTPTRRRCGGWAPTRSRPTATLRRESVSYAEELRPVDAAAA